MVSPLAAFPIVSTEDPDLAQQVLSRELVDLHFESVRNRRSFQFGMDGIHLGQTLVGFTYFATDTVIDAGVLEGMYSIDIANGNVPFVFHIDGTPIFGNESGAVTSPSRKVVLQRPAGSGAYIIRVKSSIVEGRMKEEVGRAPKKPVILDPSVDLRLGVGAQARRLLNHFVDTIHHGPEVLQYPLLRKSFDEMFLNLLLSLPNNYFDQLVGVGRSLPTPGIVKRAEEFLEANATEPITISELVAESRCSRTTLFRAFQRYRGYSPMQFLAELRLQSAREALLSASPTNTVTSIAYRSGFSHLGRFTEAYSQRFGETPSETLRKSIQNSEKLRLLDMGYLGPEVDINRDFPQFPIVLEPGEKLQTVLSIRIAEPGFIKAGKFFLAYEIVPLNGQPKSAKDKTLPPADLACFPSPDKLLDIQIEPLCSYNDKGIKTEIVITPRGDYAFKDLRVHIEPPEKVISCQSIHRTMFPKKQATEKVSSRNGTSEMEKNNEIKLDALLQPGDIDFVVEFVALGSRTQVRLPRTVKIPEQIRHEKAQLLEPRRVFKPDIDVEEIRDSGDKKISDVRAAYPLHGGRKYKITIMPKPGDNVNKISMQDIHGRIQVRSANQTNYETQQGEHEKWTFEIEITFSELLRHSDRLHYIVESKDRSMFGEIFVVLLPPWYKGLLFAGAVGASATLQGFVALGRRIFTPDVSLKETVANLLAGHDYQIWFLLSIPVLWLLVWLADRAIYRLRS